MITATEREAEFKKDFKKLLIKHAAMLELSIECDPYSYSESPVLEVIMPTVSGEVTRDVKREYARFSLDLDQM